MPVYDIRYLESPDPTRWSAKGAVHIPITGKDEHGFGRPSVIRSKDGLLRMFYSVRRISLGAYRLGYAESIDGIHWMRLDQELNLDVGQDSFDSEAIMYAAPIQLGEHLYLFYNGNGFGREGFGIAKLLTE